MKRIIATIITIGCLLLPAQIYAAANNYYVTQNGKGTNDGKSMVNSWSVSDFNSPANWSTTDHPNRIDPGDTVYFSGTVTTILKPQGGGTSGNYITLDGWEGGTCDPIESECTSSAEITAPKYSFWLRNQDYIIIQDFRMPGNTLQLAGTSQGAKGSDYIIIRRNFVHDNTGNGIDIDYATYITIGGASGDGNVVKDVGTTTAHSDVSFESVDDGIISYNWLYATKSTGASTDRGIDGIVTQPADGVLIEYNTIHSHKAKHSYYGENAIDLKSNTKNVIIRFNHIYDHWQEAHVLLHGGTQNVYVYGNLFRDGFGGILLYQRSGYNTLKDNHIWANIFSGLADMGVGTASSGGSMGTNYVYNNTMAYNGYDCTKLSGASHTAGPYNNGIRLELGKTHIKNNIFYKNHPEMADYLQASTTSTSNIGSLEHNTFYWPSRTSYIRSGGVKRNIANLQSTSNLDNDLHGVNDADPNFEDPDGADNTYGTVDDNFTLLSGSSAIDSGTDLSECFNVTIQGIGNNICYDDGLDPANTNWTTIPPTVGTIKQKENGSWDRGAYVYTGDALCCQTISPPSSMRIME